MLRSQGVEPPAGYVELIVEGPCALVSRAACSCTGQDGLVRSSDGRLSRIWTKLRSDFDVGLHPGRSMQAMKWLPSSRSGKWAFPNGWSSPQPEKRLAVARGGVPCKTSVRRPGLCIMLAIDPRCRTCCSVTCTSTCSGKLIFRIFRLALAFHLHVILAFTPAVRLHWHLHLRGLLHAAPGPDQHLVGHCDSKPYRVSPAAGADS